MTNEKVKDMQKHQEYLTRKLKHYNEWLLDEDRESGTVYPGFPEDEVKVKTTPVKSLKGKFVMMIETPKIEKIAKAVKAPKVQAIKVARGPKEGTKQSKAVELLRGMAFVTKAEKAECIEKIVSELGMSKAGATTYAYNAQRILLKQANQVTA